MEIKMRAITPKEREIRAIKMQLEKAFGKLTFLNPSKKSLEMSIIETRKELMKLEEHLDKLCELEGIRKGFGMG